MRRLSRSEVRFSRLHVSAEIIEATAGDGRRLVQPGSERQGAQGDPTDGPNLDPSRTQHKSLDDLARMFNPNIRGWINYYGAYYKTALAPVMAHFDKILSRWAMRKYKSLTRQRNAHRWVRSVAGRQPALFAHWASFGAAAG